MPELLHEARTLWVCIDCYLVHHGYDEHELGHAPDREPLSLIDDGVEVHSGMALEEHDEDCRNAGAPVEDCQCGRITFSRTACQGCGSRLAGAREALTVTTTNPPDRGVS